jgi:3'-5' exoribonuclease
MTEPHPLLGVQELKALEPGSGRVFSAVLVLKRLNVKTANNGNTFLSLELGDRNGSFSCTLFSDNPSYETIKASGEGAVFQIEAKADFYQGRFSPRISSARELNEQELSDTPGLMENLIEVSPEDPNKLWEELQGYIQDIPHEELRQTVRGAFEEIGDHFRWAPAAVSMHHAYRHGLLEHTVHMARICKAILPFYKEVDPSLAMAGILLHDTGKIIEYEGTLATKRSRKGILQGHVVLGYQITRKAGLKAKLDPDRQERLEHIILSHQGEPEWGAAVYAATPEAVLVSMIDNLDAKMGMVQRALRQSLQNEEFSERLPGLNTPLLVKHL